jgi:hypothetical protein
MSSGDSDDYAKLSLTAKLALGLHCFAGYCRVRKIDHPAITAFLDDLWEFPIISNPVQFGKWQESHPTLVAVALGDDYPIEFEEFLVENLVSPVEFRDLLANVVEIIFSSFYVASDNGVALQFLDSVLTIVRKHGVISPPKERFAASRFCDRHGWGQPLTPLERDIWRAEEPPRTPR